MLFLGGFCASIGGGGQEELEERVVRLGTMLFCEEALCIEGRLMM